MTNSIYVKATDSTHYSTIRSQNQHAQDFAVQNGFTFVSQEPRDGSLRNNYRYIK